jgi:hypothetical protein
MTEETPVPKTLTPTDVHAVVATAPSAAGGLLRVLTMSGAWLPDDVAEALTEAIQARGDGEPPYVQVLRHSMEYVQNKQYHDVTVWELRERSLRSLLREGKVFAAQPVITVHQLDPFADDGMSSGPALTEEQIAELPREAWAEIRLTVPTRTLPDTAPAAPEPALETR